MSGGGTGSTVRGPAVLGSVVLGELEVVREVGVGGFATVYEVRDRRDGARAALKVLHRAYAEDPTVASRLMREAGVAARAGSARIVETRGAGMLEDGSPYVLMELLEGCTLRARLERSGALSIAEAAEVGLGIAEGLASAHAAGVVHRDLKPENVFLEGGSVARVKLLDFGLTKLLPGHEDRFGALTRSGALMGTIHYLAPEQARATKDLDGRVDVYALGVMLYEMVAGTVPYPSKSIVQALGELLTGDHVPVQMLRADLPPAMGAVIERAFHRDRERRPTIGELLVALRPLAAPAAPARDRGRNDPGGAPLARPQAGRAALPRSLDGATVDAFGETAAVEVARLRPALDAVPVRHPPSREPAPGAQPAPRPGGGRPTQVDLHGYDAIRHPPNASGSWSRVTRGLVVAGLGAALLATAAAAAVVVGLVSRQAGGGGASLPAVAPPPPRRLAGADDLQMLADLIAASPDECLRLSNEFAPTPALLQMRMQCAMSANRGEVLVQTCQQYYRLYPNPPQPDLCLQVSNFE